MVSGLLMELEDHNCWTIAEAAGHHRLQHLLSRAVWDDRQVLDIASAWAAVTSMTGMRLLRLLRDTVIPLPPWDSPGAEFGRHP
jgi:hypothetical protein